MKKTIISSLIVFSIILSPALKADGSGPRHSNTITSEEVAQPLDLNTNEQQGSSLDNSTPLAVDPVTEELPEEQGSAVGQASNEGMSAAKKKQWTNIAIAVCAVAVAVTALILVASNDGHKQHHKNK